MTNETTNETKRVSKLDTLNAALVAAKAALASAQATLQPQIDAEQEKVHALRTARDKADKVSDKAYETYQAALRSAESRLFPTETSKKLLEAIKAKVTPQFPHADYVRLAHDYKAGMIAADADVVAAKVAHSAAYKARDQASMAWNRANAFDSPLYQLTRKLEGFKERVAVLEKEIERLPTRNSAARDRRAAAKQEQLEAEQTQAARALLAADGFDWAVEK